MSTILCAHTAYFKEYLQTHFLCLLHQRLRISSAAKVINSPCDEATPLTTALRVVGMVKQPQKTQSCLQYFAPIPHTPKNTSKLIFCGLLHQRLRISSTANVINSPVTKRHRSQQRYESLGWLNNGRKRNRVYNTLRPYRILHKIPPNSFSVGFASKRFVISSTTNVTISARHEATPLTTALRVVGMVKQRQKTQSCLQYCAPIPHILQEIPPNSFSVGCCIKRFVYHRRRRL